MNSRERIKSALSHKQPDKLPVDFGGMLATGMHVSIVYKLRQKFGLDKPLTPVKVIEPYQMLGEIADDLKEILGVDCTSVTGKYNLFGFENKDWKEWELYDGTPLLVPGLFNTKPQKDGSVFMYPQGDIKVPPSAKMPYKGYYFDNIIRQEKIDEDNLNIEDNLEEFKLLSDEELEFIKKVVDERYNNTEYAVIGSIVSSGFGDIALVPGPTLKNPKGIRDIAEWYISIVARKEYVYKVFDKQCEIALENYKRINNIVGKKLDVVFVTGTDFAAQNGLFISKELYNSLYKPFHIKVNKWIHENTNWKSFFHSCGAIESLIEEIIDSGFDILNPIQISCKNMDSVTLKKKYGKYITFWGGGIDTQRTLPFGTPKTVSEEVKGQIDIFNNDGGYIFSSVHNIQANTPIENIFALIEVIHKYRE